MFLHMIQKWPNKITINLRPFVPWMPMDLYNATPIKSELYTGQKGKNWLDNFHTLGCPTFVLQPRLQQGQKILKWEPRSRMGVYLGHSPVHAQMVQLVLNLQSGLILSQYHLV